MMRRICWCFGLISLAVAATASTIFFHAAGSSTATTNQPIPAMSSSTLLTAPLWSLYVGPAICLLVAAIMLWRCHAAGKCQCMRKVYHAVRREDGSFR